MTPYPIMLDGVAADVPAIHAWMQAHGQHPVAGYTTGGPPIEWSEAQFGLFTRKIRICQRPWVKGDALDARVVDVEPGAADAASVVPFVDERAHDAHRGDGTVYCSLDTVPSILAEIKDTLSVDLAAAIDFVPRWWLAWYWGRRYAPTPLEVLAELERLTGITLPLKRLWACQFRPLGFMDQSAVYGAQDYSRR